MSRIFLSHTSTDKPFVRQLGADLRNYGHTVWIDEAEINIGDSLIGKIREGLDSVDYVAVVLSNASLKSEWVSKELEIASNREIKEKRIVVLPLIIEKVEMPGFLEGKLYGDFSTPDKYDASLQLLLRSLGDNIVIPHSKDEIEAIKQELADAKALILEQITTMDRVNEYNLSTKSDELKEIILRENKRHPEYAPINNVYAFQIGEVKITLGYLLYAISKMLHEGTHQIVPLLAIYNKWDDANRMIDAYSDMINSQRKAD